MSGSTHSPDGDTAQTYSKPEHVKKYGLQQHQPGLDTFISISWRGSARELIREEAADAWESLDPNGCALICFHTHETTVKVRTFAEAKALDALITDEIHRRRVNQRQRNSLHGARDKLRDAFDEQAEAVERSARKYYNGHEFRETGEIPSPTVPVADVELNGEGAAEKYFKRARAKYHLSRRPDVSEIERVSTQLPLMYGYY